MYDWDDNGVGDNKSGPDHVGIVEKVSGNTITVIEGNYSNAVKRRTLLVNGKYIRGYIVPKYEAEKAEEPKVEAAAPADTAKHRSKRSWRRVGSMRQKKESA